MCVRVWVKLHACKHMWWHPTRIHFEVKATLSQFVSLWLSTGNQRSLCRHVLFPTIPPSLSYSPTSRPSLSFIPPPFILTSLALRIQSCLRTLRWFKSITLGDRKTLLRCSDWGLLKFISCGIRPEIKKKKKKMQLRRAKWCIWMFMCVCVWICQVFMKKEGRRVKGVRVINAWWSHEVSTSLNYLHTPLFLSSWYFPPSLQLDNTSNISSHPA